MPGGADSGEGRAFTRFERALEAVLAISHADGRDACAAFWQAWQLDGSTVLRTVADFRDACDPLDGPADLLQRCSDLVTGASNADLRKNAKKPLVDLVKALLLAASERYLGAAAVVTEPASGSILAVQVNDPTTAGLVAAGRSGSGARLVPHPSTGRPVIQNLLRDSPALAYTGKENADCDAWGAELHAWAGTALEQPESWVDPSTLRAKISANARAVAPQFVCGQLARVEREQHIRPLIAFSAQDPATATLNASLLTKLNAEFRQVYGFVHAAGSDAAQTRLAHQLESTVQDYVSTIFAALDPAFAAQPQQPALVSGRREVFICYAHADDAKWLKAIQSQIRALGGDIPIQPWSDEAIHTGDDWKAKIDEALDRSACAVLIVAKGFLGSDFIQRHEVPHLLKRRAQGQLHLLPILAGPCNHQTHDWLPPLQMRSINVALSGLSEHDAEDQLSKLAGEIFAKLHSTRP